MKPGKPILKPAAPQPANHTVSFHVTNCTAKDAQFIGGVIKLFCDPALAVIAAELRRGTLALEYKPDTGEAFAFDINQRITDASRPWPN